MQWLGAVRQQAITWANVDPELCRHMASLDLNELTLLPALISNPMPSKVLDDFICPFPNFWKGISNFTQQNVTNVITYPLYD